MKAQEIALEKISNIIDCEYKTAPSDENGEYYLVGTSILRDGKINLEDANRVSYSTYREWTQRRVPQAGDIIISREAPVGEAGLIKEGCKVCLGQRTVLIQPKKKIVDNLYLLYFLISLYTKDQFSVLSTGSVVPRLNLKDLRSFRVAVPHLSEQEAIATYLDTKTAQIDRKIDLLTQKAQRYEELKRSLINETVTGKRRIDNGELIIDKKIDNRKLIIDNGEGEKNCQLSTVNYPLYKDSGIEWIGEIPQHWECSLIKRFLCALTDYTANGSFAVLAENVSYQESGYARLVRLTDLRQGFNNSGLFVSENAYNFLSKTKIRGGEILIANVGAYTGLVQLVPNIDFKATLGPNMFLAVFDNKLLHKFISYQLGSSSCFQQLRVQMTTTAQPKLNKDNFRSISIVIPPIDEQRKIVDYLDAKTSQIDQIIQTIKSSIEKQKELRKTLINDVVTGKIKVIDNGE
ncbi:MAG: restriction endonuclease subunit S [Cyanobacteria bacterium J06639_14]